MSIISMAEDIKLVDSFLLAIGKTDRGGDVEKNVVLDFIRHIRAAQKIEKGESPVNNTQQLKASITLLQIVKYMHLESEHDQQVPCHLLSKIEQRAAV